MLAAEHAEELRLGARRTYLALSAASRSPPLVVQAGAMSRPIPSSLGFRPVCEIVILEDGGVVAPGA